MGNTPSKIDLTSDSPYTTEQSATVTFKSQEYNENNNFKKHTQTIKYRYEYQKVYLKKYFHISFSKTIDTVRVFYYYIRDENDIVDEIEVFFSKKHVLIPLIIGLKTRKNNEFKYYKYVYLRDEVKSSNGLPTNELNSANLKKELEEENNKRNKLTFKIGSVTKNCLQKTYNRKNFLEYMYYVDEQKTYAEYVFSTDKLFQHEKRNDGIDYSFLNTVKDQLFDEISVFYYKQNGVNKAILIAFVADSDTKYFKRKDFDGFYWVNEEMPYYTNYNLEPELEGIKGLSQKQITVFLHKNDSYGSVIQFQKEEVRPTDLNYNYTIYEHTPKNEYVNARPILFYKSHLVKLMEDNQMLQNTRLETQQKSLLKIKTYSYDRTKEVHLLVKFETPDKGNKFFKRVDKTGANWKQIVKQDSNLEKTGVSDELIKIEYEINKSIKIQLEHRDNNGYPVNLVENSSISKLSESIAVNNLKIKVTDKTECIDDNNYKCYFHDLTLCSSRDVLSEVAGLRLYDNAKEIKIYKNDGEDNRMYLHYLPCITKADKLYVYFDNTGQTILLVCYNNKSYKSKSKRHPQLLVLDADFRSCECTSSNKSTLKSKLDEIKKNLESEPNTISSVEAPVNLGSSRNGDSIATHDTANGKPNSGEHSVDLSPGLTGDNVDSEPANSVGREDDHISGDQASGVNGKSHSEDKSQNGVPNTYPTLSSNGHTKPANGTSPSDIPSNVISPVLLSSDNDDLPEIQNPDSLGEYGEVDSNYPGESGENGFVGNFLDVDWSKGPSSKGSEKESKAPDTGGIKGKTTPFTSESFRSFFKQIFKTLGRFISENSEMWKTVGYCVGIAGFTVIVIYLIFKCAK